tara:strand:- start:477 stop:680 length:204 start_codon:yes stop_codon:yes gene_type:complete
MKKFCIFGLGYIGLLTSDVLTQDDYEVIVVDINNKVVQSINNRKVHIGLISNSSSQPNQKSVQKTMK